MSDPRLGSHHMIMAATPDLRVRLGIGAYERLCMEVARKLPDRDPCPCGAGLASGECHGQTKVIAFEPSREFWPRRADSEELEDPPADVARPHVIAAYSGRDVLIFTSMGRSAVTKDGYVLPSPVSSSLPIMRSFDEPFEEGDARVREGYGQLAVLGGCLFAFSGEPDAVAAATGQIAALQVMGATLDEAVAETIRQPTIGKGTSFVYVSQRTERLRLRTYSSRSGALTEIDRPGVVQLGTASGSLKDAIFSMGRAMEKAGPDSGENMLTHLAARLNAHSALDTGKRRRAHPYYSVMIDKDGLFCPDTLFVFYDSGAAELRTAFMASTAVRDTVLVANVADQPPYVYIPAFGRDVWSWADEYWPAVQQAARGNAFTTITFCDRVSGRSVSVQMNGRTTTADLKVIASAENGWCLTFIIAPVLLRLLRPTGPEDRASYVHEPAEGDLAEGTLMGPAS